MYSCFRNILENSCEFRDFFFFFSSSPYCLGISSQACSIPLPPSVTELPSPQLEFAPVKGHVYKVRICNREGKGERGFKALHPSLPSPQWLPKTSFGWFLAHLSPHSSVLFPLQKCSGIWAQFPWKYRQIDSSPSSNQRLRQEQIERLQLLDSLYLFPLAPPQIESSPLTAHLHFSRQAAIIQWQHALISTVEDQGRMRWPRRDRPLSARQEWSIWFKITQQWRAVVYHSHRSFKLLTKICPTKASRCSHEIIFPEIPVGFKHGS